MAGTLRRKISRPLRRPAFNEEILRSFVELEHMDQASPEFDSGSRRLADALDLGDEYFLSGVSVNCKSEESCWPDNHPATEDFERVRAVRLALLEAIAARSPPQLTEPEAAAVRQAAIPVPDEHREAFFHDVASALQGRSQPGPGDVDRAVRDAQRKHFSPPDLTRMNGIGGYDLKLLHKRG
jgi:hypothetical protein